MHIEGEPSPEILSRGRFYFLSHPDANLFAGYGLSTHDGRSDRLVGLLMVDRPHPADPAWLADVERLYGEYQLVPMTRSGERGLVTQMRVEPDSQRFLQTGPQPFTDHLARALHPLLEEPPAPVLKVRWDSERWLWHSEFWLGLPPALQAVFERSGEGALAVERADSTVAFVTHASDADIASFRQAQVVWHWELVEMPTAPLIRFRAAILDRLRAPYVLEHFLNLDDADQARCLSQLVQQEELTFDLYGHEYRYSKRIAHPERMRQGLAEIVRQAGEVYVNIPAAARDFDQAKAEFQRRFPV